MARSQRERSQYNPLNLGTFSQTSLRMLIGDLGPKSEIIQGGYGNYTYDHWFQITIDKPAWIIAIKAGSKLATENINPLSNVGYATNRRFSISVYDENKTPIEGRNINDKESGYWNHVAGAQSDLYNTYNLKLANKGNELYFPLEPGNYLLCISATRNELMTYAVGLVIEFQTPIDELFFLCEDASDVTYLITENALGESVVENVPNTVTSGITLSTLNGFTENLCTIIDPNGVVQVNYQNSDGNPLSWLIGPNPGTLAITRVLLDATENWIDTTHEHSLTEWREAWQRDHLREYKFPVVFSNYTNTP